MAYYQTCQLCGANLDPGERCDCMKKALHTDQSARASHSLENSSQQEGNPIIAPGSPLYKRGRLFEIPQKVKREEEGIQAVKEKAA